MSEQKIEKENVISVIKTIYNIFDAWGLSNNEQMSALGVTGIKYEEFRNPDLIRVDEDFIKRCSYILGIYKNLQILLPDTQAADSWVNRKNTAKFFNGKSPREFIITGNFGDLRLVHQFVASMSHGNA